MIAPENFLEKKGMCSTKKKKQTLVIFLKRGNDFQNHICEIRASRNMINTGPSGPGNFWGVVRGTRFFYPTEA